MLKAWKNVYQKKSNNSSCGGNLEQGALQKETDKDRILDDVGRAIKLLLQYGLSQEVVRLESWVAQDLCQRLDEALLHGLRRPNVGFWPFVRIFTHSNNICLLESGSISTFDKGRAWLYQSLNEGSLESYLRSFSGEHGVTRKHYGRDAFLRDSSRREIFLGLLASLRDVHFELVRVGTTQGYLASVYTDSLLQNAGDKTSITPLPSPEDSGVALLDSDLSEMVESLLDDQEDEVSLNELEDNRINRLLSLEMDSGSKCNDDSQPTTEENITEKSDKAELRTPQKLSNETRHLKRVSFHEESMSQPHDFSASFIAPGTTAVLKKDAVKGRYSWCAGNDAPFIVCPSGTTETKSGSVGAIECVEERGVPEGQEDEFRLSERMAKPTKEEIVTLRRQQILRKLKQRKIKPLLHWPRVKPNRQTCQQLSEEINQEIEEHKCREVVLQPVTPATLSLLQTTVFCSSTETIYKVFKAHGPLMQSEIHYLLVILSNKAIYIVSSDFDAFVPHFTIEYSNLQAVLLGPSGQTVILCTRGTCGRQVMLALSEPDGVGDLVGSIEMASRRAGVALPAWRRLDLEEMRFLWHSLGKLVPALQREQLLYLCLAHTQDESRVLTGSSKEGLLMMRIGQVGPWLPAFLGLRESELWVFGDEIEREPQLVLSLARCQGCHRAPMAERPHAFEIVCGRGTEPLQLAAADEYEASEWLQALLQAASGAAVVSEQQSSRLQLCGLVLSAGHLLAYSLEQPEPQLVSCAALPHLTALRATDKPAPWCVLEFECSEAQESSGDWLLYFPTVESKANFCAQLETVWSSLAKLPFPGVLAVPEEAVPRCREASLQLRAAWDPLLSLGFALSAAVSCV